MIIRMFTGLLAALVLLIGLAQPGPAWAQQPEADGPPTQSVAADLPSPQEQLARILDGSMYQRWKLRQTAEEARTLGSHLRWLEDWQDRIGKWLDNWFKKKQSDRPPAKHASSSMLPLGALLRVIAWIVAAVLVVLLLIIGYRMFRDWRATPRQTATISRRKLQQAMEEGHALAASSPVWLAEADRLAQSNDLRLAYRAIYLGLLSGLHSANRIDYKRNRTNWIYVNRYRGFDDQRRTFAKLTHIFDDVWYGWHTAELASLDQVRLTVTHLLAEASPPHA